MRLHISKYSSSTRPLCAADISFSSSLAAVTSVFIYVLFISVPYLKLDLCHVLQAGLLFLLFTVVKLQARPAILLLHLINRGRQQTGSSLLGSPCSPLAKKRLSALKM